MYLKIVHGHSAFSTLAHEALFVGSLLELGTVFTDHSLFGFADASAIITNTFLRYSLANTDHCICVSHTGKENTVLRSGVPKTKVSVIPNAVDSDIFLPCYNEPGTWSTFSVTQANPFNIFKKKSTNSCVLSKNVNRQMSFLSKISLHS